MRVNVRMCMLFADHRDEMLCNINDRRGMPLYLFVCLFEIKKIADFSNCQCKAVNGHTIFQRLSSEDSIFYANNEFALDRKEAQKGHVDRIYQIPKQSYLYFFQYIFQVKTGYCQNLGLKWDLKLLRTIFTLLCPH